MSGDCAWAAFSEPYYRGERLMLVPGSFAMLPEPMNRYSVYIQYILSNQTYIYFNFLM